MGLLTRKNTIESKLVYGGVIVNLRVDQVRDAEGRTFVRELVEHNGGVVIACQPEPDKVILIRQYRYSVDEEIFELPAGRLEKGEDPLRAAQRELIEETGYKASEWSELVRMYSAPGFCNEVLYLYRASGLEFIGKSLDADEETEVDIVSLDEAWDMAVAGRLKDAKTIAGVALLRSAARSAG